MQKRTEETLQNIQTIIADLKEKGERITNKRIGELCNGGISKQRIHQILKSHELNTKFNFDRKSYITKLKNMNIDTSKLRMKQMKWRMI